MANVINATSTGNGGLITTGDDSGILNIQTNETTAVSVDASQNLTFTNGINAPNTFGFKNRLINGDMRIDQRNAGALVSPANGYTLDRWYVQESTDGTVSVQQSTTAPSGFYNSLVMTVTGTDSSIGATQYTRIFQCIEGLNVTDLNWGSANAKTVTLSFWVRCSVAGTYGGSVENSAADRSYPFNFTVNSVDTWEQKTVTIPGDQSGTWLNTNGIGIFLQICVACGSSLVGTANTWAGANYLSATGTANLMATNGATFYITGVQLEKGTQATSFDFRPYTTEQQLCYRYYEKWGTGQGNMLYIGGGIGMVWAATEVRIQLQYADKRAAPTCSASGTVTWADGTSANATMTSFNFDNPKTKTVLFYGNVGSALIQGRAAQIWWPGTGSFNLEISAEL